MHLKFYHTLIILMLFQSVVSSLYAQTDTLPIVRKVDPPFNNFYSKLAYCDGIPIRSAAVVSDSGLIVAYKRIQLMLQYIPSVQRRLVRRGAELHIIGKDQQPSDLPEFQGMKGKKIFTDTPVPTDVDERTRGMGGLYASCGEENLLGLFDDRYYSCDICVHEFAHDLMNSGLDSAARNKIHRQYLRAMSKGLWAGNYAAVNDEEYWAELSMWYFGSHGAFLKGTMLPEPGSEGLRKYDPEGYDLLNDIYSRGRVIAPRVPDITQPTLVAKSRHTEKRLAALCWFTIFNNTDEPLNANWMDFDGKPELYAIVKPHTNVKLQTFSTHIWMLADLKQTIGYYEIRGIDCRLSVGDATK
jgi:hypothetical protein